MLSAANQPRADICGKSANIHPAVSQYTARIATNEQTRLDAYRLRYESYLASNHILPNETGIFRDKYDDMANCQTIVIYETDRAVASVRTCVVAHQTSQICPAMDAYPAEVAELLGPNAIVGRGGQGIETTRLVRSPGSANNQGLVFLLYRMAGYVGMMAGTDVLLASARKNHVPFYKRLGYVPVTEPRAYPGLTCPMQLLGCSRERYEEVREAFPVLDPFADGGDYLSGFLDGDTVPLSLLPRAR